MLPEYFPYAFLSAAASSEEVVMLVWHKHASMKFAVDFYRAESLWCHKKYTSSL